MRAPLRAVLLLLMASICAAVPLAARRAQPFDARAVAPSTVEGQQPPSQNPPGAQTPQPPVIKARINAVSVDVIVTSNKSGEPVLDLNRDDFEVREDGKPQKVETFQVIKLDNVTQALDPVAPRAITSTYDEEREARQPDVRLFVLFLD